MLYGSFSIKITKNRNVRLVKKSAKKSSNMTWSQNCVSVSHRGEHSHDVTMGKPIARDFCKWRTQNGTRWLARRDEHEL